MEFSYKVSKTDMITSTIMTTAIAVGGMVLYAAVRENDASRRNNVKLRKLSNASELESNNFEITKLREKLEYKLRKFDVQRQRDIELERAKAEVYAEMQKAKAAEKAERKAVAKKTKPDTSICRAE